MFVLSKLFSAVTQPMFWLGLWWLVALVLLARRRRTATVMLWIGLVVMVLLGFRAFPDALLRPLENQYSVPDPTTIGHYAGVIVLGGALGHPETFKTHGQVPLGEAAERMTVPVNLLREHPQYELVFTGGEGRLLTTGTTEAELAQVFFTQQGVDMSRMRFESGSRNTLENAQRVADTLKSDCQQPWLLVTSAAHMPRAMLSFTQAFEGSHCKITPYPVDFRTAKVTPFTEYSLAHGLVRWQSALHEWLGLLVYRLMR